MSAETILAEGTVLGERAESSIFALIFGAFESKGSKAFLMDHNLLFSTPVQDWVFPWVALVQWLLAVLAIYQLFTAKNRNFSKTANALLTPTKAMVNTTAITIGILITKHVLPLTFAVSVPYLFVGMIAVYVLWTAGSAAYHAYKMCQAPEDSALRETHREAMKTNLIHTAVGIVLCLVVGGLFAAGVSSPVGLGVLATIGIVVLVGAVLVHKYRTKKQIEKNPLRLLVPEKKIRGLVSNMDTSEINRLTKAGGDEHDRFYVRDLKPLLDAAKKVDDKSGENNNYFKKHKYLVKIFAGVIEAKIQELKSQKENASSYAQAHPFFNLFVIDESQKRTNKIDGLNRLKRLIVGHIFVKPKDINAAAIDTIINDYPKIFQSFKREKSDVELIFDTAREYFTQPQDIPKAKHFSFSF